MPKPSSRFEREIRGGKIVPGMSFSEKVWAMTVRVPRGRVATYADIAKQLKSRGYRAVGAALHVNPYAPQVPCHRIVGSDGRLTGFAGGVPAKRRLLRSEGITIVGDKIDLNRHRAASVSSMP